MQGPGANAWQPPWQHMASLKLVFYMKAFRTNMTLRDGTTASIVGHQVDAFLHAYPPIQRSRTYLVTYQACIREEAEKDSA